MTATPSETATAAWLTEPEAAERLNVGASTLQTWRLRGKYGPPFARFGRAVRYRVIDVDAWAAAQVKADR